MYKNKHETPNQVTFEKGKKWTQTRNITSMNSHIKGLRPNDLSKEISTLYMYVPLTLTNI